jgi:ABC-2 type transport system permease protein
MTVTTAPLPKTPPRAAFGKIVLNEARLAWRQPAGLAAGVGIPVLLTVIFGELPKFQQPQASLGGLTYFDVYVPVLAMFATAILALWGLPVPLASYREHGILRRLQTTPVPRSWLLAAQVAVQLCLALAGLLTVILVGVIAFGAPDAKNPAAMVAACAFGIAGLFPVGLSIAALAPTSATASVIGRLTFVPLMFFAGLWLPRALMPAVLRDISACTPVGAAVVALQDSMQGQFPPAAPLLTLAGYALAFSLLAWRFFRWE